MGADNWAKCPKCKQLAESKAEKAAAKLEKQYGKISAEEFLRRTDDLKATNQGLGETLSEYYEIGIRKDGKFYVDYGANCLACGFEFSFKEEKEVVNL